MDSRRLQPHEATTPRRCCLVISDAGMVTLAPHTHLRRHSEFFPSLPWYPATVRCPNVCPLKSFALGCTFPAPLGEYQVVRRKPDPVNLYGSLSVCLFQTSVGNPLRPVPNTLGSDSLNKLPSALGQNLRTSGQAVLDDLAGVSANTRPRLSAHVGELGTAPTVNLHAGLVVVQRAPGRHAEDQKAPVELKRKTSNLHFRMLLPHRLRHGAVKLRPECRDVAVGFAEGADLCVGLVFAHVHAKGRCVLLQAATGKPVAGAQHSGLTEAALLFGDLFIGDAVHLGSEVLVGVKPGVEELHQVFRLRAPGDHDGLDATEVRHHQLTPLRCGDGRTYQAGQCPGEVAV